MSTDKRRRRRKRGARVDKRLSKKVIIRDIEEERESNVLKKEYETEKMKTELLLKKREIKVLEKEIRDIQRKSSIHLKKFEMRNNIHKYKEFKLVELIDMIVRKSKEYSEESLILITREELIQILLDLKTEKKRCGRPKKQKFLENLTANEVAKTNRLNISNMRKKYILRDCLKTFEGYYFQKYQIFYSSKRLQSCFSNNLLFSFCNGWNSPIFMGPFANLDPIWKKKIGLDLPSHSFNFEKIFTECVEQNLKLKSELMMLGKVPVLKRWTKKGYCLNRGCMRLESKCSFVTKYDISYIYRENVFIYILSAKGGHDKMFMLEAPKSTKLSMKSKLIIKDGLEGGLNNKKIIKNNKLACRVHRSLGMGSMYKIAPRTISSMRYYEKQKIWGKYKDGFNKILNDFGNMRNLELVSLDPHNLNMTCLLKDKKIFSENIFQMYCDGTFKTKFWMNAHYNVLVFAINLPESLRTIPIGFTISFKNTSDVYEKLWEKLAKMFKRMGVDISYLCMISDMGSAELKFIKKIRNLFNQVYCWFHVLKQTFIPRLWKETKDKTLIESVKTKIRFLYCSKTLTQRNERVKILKRFLNRMLLPNFLNFLVSNGYLGDEKLDLWTSLYKISQYSEHTSNYLERFFGNFSESLHALQTKLPEFIRCIDDEIGHILTLHYDFGNITTKMKSSNKKLKDGISLFLSGEFEEVSYLFYEITGIVSNVDPYDVDLKNFCCSCPDFNVGGYVCKHMFCIMLNYRFDTIKNFNIKDIEINAFKFIKETRLMFVKIPLLRKMIEIQDFPVTIGEDAFVSKYLT